MTILPTLSADKADFAAKQVMGKFDAPAYVRRARQMEDAIEQLLAQCRQKRSELLEIVALRLGVLHELAGSWQHLRRLLGTESDLKILEHLHAELAPNLRLPVERTTSVRRLRNAFLDLRASLVRFNRRWSAFLPDVDLGPVNALIDGYNRYYVLEKECVVRSGPIARQGFRPREHLTLERLTALLPPLPVPQPRS